MNSQEFPRTVRLLLAADFSRVFKKPVRSADRYFTVLARSNGGSQARLGLAIAKKQVKLAVDRNRVKRLIRESFRTQQDQLQGLDFVVMAKSHIIHQHNAQLRLSLQTHWNKLNHSPSA